MWPFGDLPMFHFRTILMDVPWAFRTWSKKGLGKSPDEHYPTMSLADIKALPVGDLARSGTAGNPDGCLLFMWATAPMLPEALDCMKRYGFTFKTMGAWHKRTVHHKTVFSTGYILRSACEPFLIGTIGEPQYNDSTAARSQRNIIDAIARAHSEKPDDQYKILEALMPGPRVELFARCKEDGTPWCRSGWSGWGLEMQRRLSVEERGATDVEPEGCSSTVLPMLPGF